MNNLLKTKWISLNDKQKSVLIAEFLSIHPGCSGTEEWHDFLNQKRVATKNALEDQETFEIEHGLLTIWQDIEIGVVRPLSVPFPHESYY